MTSRSLNRDLVRGALGFALVSVLAFSLWAFAGRWFPGDGALYTAIAVVFLGGSGLVLAPLAGGAGRFYRAFVPAFLVYSVLWCVAWFGIGGKPGEWAGAVAGGLAFTGISLWVLGGVRGWFGAALAFLVFHCAGYFAGDWVYAYAKIHAPQLAETLGLARPQFVAVGRLAWGLLYGLGFGAGIGWVFHQGRIKGGT
ncbi:MAG: hypothetical protein U0984_12555 [Prosthecobacter sp.]|nr:hypothetical protein [Prosthecobacter sp.]